MAELELCLRCETNVADLALGPMALYNGLHLQRRGYMCRPCYDRMLGRGHTGRARG